MADKHMVVLYKQDGLFYRRLGECKSNDKGLADWPSLLEAHQREIAALQKKVAHHYKEAMEAATIASYYSEEVARLLNALKRAIEFVPTGYGIERQCWEAIAAAEALLETPNAKSHRTSRASGEGPVD